ncbi:CDP-diacylglycerol--glycerol-3-phosphate 3-phosphatidyltransferase [Roseibacillus persicicus]|uniref:CDP-diacylglycerol--glycerol-3-phosphate 3-phosphatidyltransferase n=1 Tax=Roseibacillus persicicus TaxID=454148 RepID=A0A918TZA5_9BACT|nr:CDP-diacylglycerol--glycerol-3-phosphate 3-phosphatidyltransferase [Roseibacillus persicicus]MDQ8188667.1 CDP-diacylglycerol--glycerol-3-phosphate 3-phosphatidyltransferase [Roseibacillus persicicus]GHC63512.1 CDP-diacylglycerol--glycerol-3-phosphate 3-phosphatidyltransferase [Roseibacillus persicicus]
MNLPNAITVARLVLAAVFVGAASLATPAGNLVALVTFVVAAFSDFLDGYLARKLNLVTSLGKLLDPLADKILVSAAFIHLSAAGLCPVWVTSLIIAREFLVTGLRQIAVEQGEVIAADNLGKWKTTFQLTFCIAALIWLLVENNPESPLHGLTKPNGWLLLVSLYGAFALTALSGFNYTWKGRHLLKG